VGLSRAEKAAAVGYLLSFGVIFALSLWAQPDPSGIGTHTRLGLPPCGLYEHTGIPCLSCGMTTSFAHMAHGEVISSFRVHPFAAVLFLALVGTWFALVYSLITGWSYFDWLERRTWAFWGPFAGVLALLSWAYKIAVTR